MCQRRPLRRAQRQPRPLCPRGPSRHGSRRATTRSLPTARRNGRSSSTSATCKSASFAAPGPRPGHQQAVYERRACAYTYQHTHHLPAHPQPPAEPRDRTPTHEPAPRVAHQAVMASARRRQRASVAHRQDSPAKVPQAQKAAKVRSDIIPQHPRGPRPRPTRDASSSATRPCRCSNVCMPRHRPCPCHAPRHGPRWDPRQRQHRLHPQQRRHRPCLRRTGRFARTPSSSSPAFRTISRRCPSRSAGDHRDHRLRPSARRGACRATSTWISARSSRYLGCMRASFTRRRSYVAPSRRRPPTRLNWRASSCSKCLAAMAPLWTMCGSV